MAAFVVSSAKPIQFQADVTALNQSNLSLSAITAAAKSGTLVQQLYDTLEPKPTGITSYGQLAKVLSVETPRVRSTKTVPVITLTAKASTGAEAARIVNTWAKLLAERVETLELSKEKQDLTAVQKQYDMAQQKLTKAEKAFAAFQGKNMVTVLTSRLNSLQQLQSSYLAQQRRITLLIKDTAFLQQQLSHQQGEQASAGNDLAVLALLLRSVNGSSASQIQVSDKTTLFSGDSIDTRVRFLANMQKDLQSQLQELDGNVSALNSKILSLQQEQQEAQDLQDQLDRSRKLALANYNSIAAQREKLESETLLHADYIQITGKAAPPRCSPKQTQID